MARQADQLPISVGTGRSPLLRRKLRPGWRWTTVATALRQRVYGPDSGYGWFRVGLAVLLSTIGGVGMWSVVVVLPSVETEFGVARASASLPYSLTMIGFAF